jgi:hypothetical protein
VADKRTARQVSKTRPKRRRAKWPGASADLPSWEQRFQELRAFRKKHGHCNVPTNYAPNPALGHWVVNVRCARRRGRLAEERIRRLDALAFAWEGRPAVPVAWKQRIDELRAFQEQHGHCHVPQGYPANIALSRWVANVRHRKKRGRLDKETVRCLDALGFSWTPRETWVQRIRALKAFKKVHGHCNVPMRYPPDPVLGHWVNGVRQRRKLGTIAEDKIRLLDALGFSWARKPPAVMVPWEQNVNALKAFRKEHGHCNVPYNYLPNRALGHWVANLRQRKKHGTLAEDKILGLDALGFRWERLEAPRLPKEPA